MTARSGRVQSAAPGQRGFEVPTNVAFGLRAGYVAIIVLATIAEPAGVGQVAVDERLRQALALAVSSRDIVDAVRNVLLFAGWGAVWVITSRHGPARPMLIRAALSGAAISAGVEAAQLVSATRVASVLDLVTNTLGAFTGALGVALLVVLARNGLGRRSYVGIPTAFLAGGYGLATLLEAFSPIFRQERLPGAWGPPLERLGLAFTHLRDAPVAALPLLDLVLFAPAGMLLVAVLAEAGVPYRSAAARTVLAGGIAYLFAELARGAAGYAIAPGAWLVHTTGLALGAGVAARGLPAFTRDVRGRSRPAVVLAVHGALMALWSLRPFLPELDGRALAAKLTIGRFVPLFAYRERMDVFTTADVAIPALQFLPVGALLAVWPVRRQGAFAGVLPAVWLVVALEAGQILVSGRLFDITDILIATASAALGWAIIRRAGYEPYGEAMPQPAPPARFSSPRKRTP